MRPSISRVLLAGAVLAAMSGCATVDLTNEWPAMVEPTGWEPKAGACSSSFAEATYRSAYTPTDCTKVHSYETVHIGQFTGDAAALDKPPTKGSTALGAAWAECDKKTSEYLGGLWRDAKIEIGVSVPSPGNWEGGARWFRCEAAAKRTQFGTTMTWTSSLKGELAKDSTLKITCFVIPKEDDKEWTEITCDKPHNGEYVGTYVSNDTWASGNDKASGEAIHRRCLSVIAGYVGLPDDGNMKYRTGTGFGYPDEDSWSEGDHSVRCYLYLDKNVTQSLKGGGAKALPIT
ncbi:MAG TPA: septum formation family protein [Candidatus Limnocylindrales bacterium]|nr:septum formation family protein [Candidatus Limnocylindrales bacterium]